MCVFLMNLMSERMSSGSAVRTTCDMKKEATPETLCTLLPPLLRRSRNSSRLPTCLTASLLDSLKCRISQEHLPKGEECGSQEDGDGGCKDNGQQC